MWLISSGAKRDIINNPNYYLNLTKNYPDYIPCPYEDQINLDIPRTFPAYSRRNSSIGYCQGFNYIVGKILKLCQNEVYIIIYLKIGRNFLDFY